MEGKRFYEFGEYRVDPEERVLKRSDQVVPLPPKAFDILMALVQRSERLTLKDDLMKVVWPDTFVEESNLTQNIFLLRKALGETAQEARYIVTVPGRGYRFSAKVKEVIPNELAGPAGSASKSGTTVAQPRRYLHVAWTGLAVVVILTGAIAYRWILSPRTPPASPPVAGPLVLKPRRSVAVLGFQNLSRRRNEAWLSTALAEMFSTELAANEQLRIVPTEDVARSKLELPLGDADSLSKSTLLKLRKNLGSDVVVLGSYTVMGDKPNARIRLDLRLQDAQAGETIAEIAAAGPKDDLFGLVSAAGSQLRKKLGVEGPSDAEAASVRASLPSDPEAARFYVQALARLRVFDALTARDLLEEAVTAEPNFPLSHAALASAWSSLGYDLKAKQEAERAFNLSGKLSRGGQLLVEGRYRELTSDWAKAVEDYRILFALFPDNLDYGLRLTQAQIGWTRSRDAQATLDSLRKLPLPASDDPRIDLAEVDLAYLLSDFKRMLTTASRAANGSKARGARLLLARARRAEGQAFYYLGENAKALTSFAEAGEIYAAAGDRRLAAGVLRDRADCLALQGEYDAALQLYRESLGVAREVGSKAEVANGLNNMAVLMQGRHDFGAAQRTYEQALAIYREIDDKKRGTVVLGNVGEALFYQGDLAGAERRYRQALDSARRIGDADAEANQLNDMAILLEARGDLPGAKKSFEHALTLWRDNNVPGSAAAMAGLGDVQLAQGNLAAAHKVLQEALAAQQKLGENELVAESRLALAREFLEEGGAAEAEPLIRQAAAEFQTAKIRDLEAVAYSLLARSLLEQAKPEAASEARQKSLTLAHGSQEPWIRISVAITAAHVAAAVTACDGSHPSTLAPATKELRNALQEARKFGFLGLELESRFALAETEGVSAQGKMRSEQLASLEADARARGYGLIARKAAAERSGPR